VVQEQVRDFPEQLRREKAALGDQVEGLHARAVAAFVQSSVQHEHRLQQETRRAEAVESQLQAVQDECRHLESQLRSSNDSLLALQSQLSRSEGEWRQEFDAVQQQLEQQVSQAESLNRQLQAQAARADEATARSRQAEAEVQQKAAVGAQVEELHARAVASFVESSVQLEKRLQLESQRADVAATDAKQANQQSEALRVKAEQLQQQLSQEQRRASDAQVAVMQAEELRASLTTECARKLSLKDDENRFLQGRCGELEQNVRKLTEEFEAYVQEITEQVAHQMSVQDGFVSYIQAFASPDTSVSDEASYLGSGVAACGDRVLLDMDEALARLLKSGTEPSSQAHALWLQLCSNSASPGSAPLRVCVNWLMQQDAAAAFGLPAFQRPAIDLALATLNAHVTFQDFKLLVVGCVAASHSLSRFFGISGSSLTISRAQFKQNMRSFGLRRLNSEAACDEALNAMDTDGSGTISFRRFDEWFSREKTTDITRELLERSPSGKF